MGWPTVDLISVALGATGALFGENIVGRVRDRIQQRQPKMQTSILREPGGSFWVRVVVSVAPTQPPLQLYTIRGTVALQDPDNSLTQAPVLLENGPGPTPVVVREFRYLVEHVPLPNEGDPPHMLTINLVGEGVKITQRYEIHHGGRWRQRHNWIMQRWVDYQMRRRFRKLRMVA